VKKPPVILVFLMLIAAVYTLGALTAAWMHQEWSGSGGWMEANLLRKGPHRLMARMSMIWFVLLLPFLIKWIHWQGWSDCGWSLPDPASKIRGALKEIGRGAGLAVLTLLPALIVMLLAGGRIWDTEATCAGLFGLAASAALSAILIGLIEETLARGIVFRSLSRCWTPWRAAIALSLTFALAHFIRPTEASFETGSILTSTMSALGSMPVVLAETSHVIVRTLNLTLMSLSLCVMVMRRGNIWMAVGAHATWVWMKKVYGYLTDSVKDTGDLAELLGQKTDSTDSFIATLLLSVLIVYILFSRQVAQDAKDG
jgi:membrane protease YdiL (CAAX protease family)